VGIASDAGKGLRARAVMGQHTGEQGKLETLDVETGKPASFSRIPGSEATSWSMSFLHASMYFLSFAILYPTGCGISVAADFDLSEAYDILEVS
jgi:hypothetical protein